MNTNRTITWGIFILIIALIIWGMIAAARKNSREELNLKLLGQVSSNDWVVGNASSTVTIIEYSDFQCPACATYYPLVKRVVDGNIDKIRFVYRHFPLPQHQNAMPAAQASEAAGNQGKFWEMYDMIFSTHDEWENATNTKEVLSNYANSLGIDIKRYAIDVDSKEVKDKISLQLKDGENAGINATPTFFINGKKINNPESYEEFTRLINESL
jgi:protein-disulfide isomerase